LNRTVGEKFAVKNCCYPQVRRPSELLLSASNPSLIVGPLVTRLIIDLGMILGWVASANFGDLQTDAASKCRLVGTTQ
jgi:hypothetical protein